jgi:hypothetical protein
MRLLITGRLISIQILYRLQIYIFGRIIMELDAAVLTQRVPRRLSETTEAASLSSTSLAEPTIAQAFEAARYLKNQWLRS